ncbi:MAG: 3'-5' exonuclease [Nanoarchaeota archaeon]
MSNQKLPIVVDLEMSGLIPTDNGIWQIGAVDLNNPEKIFFDESRIDDDEIVDEGALKVIGKTEEQLRNPKKQSQQEMIEKFFSWVELRPLRNLLCQNPQFDAGFLAEKARKYGIKKTFHYRSFDLHSIAQTKYHEVNGKFSTHEHNSSMDLKGILEFCGVPDLRIQLRDGKVIQEGNPHNALEDAKLTGECFFRIIFGKNIFPEYAKYKIPKYLEREGTPRDSIRIGKFAPEDKRK